MEENTSGVENSTELLAQIETTSGVERADVLTKLGQINWDLSKYRDGIACNEAARELYLEDGRDIHIYELIDVNFGIMNCLAMLARYREAGDAAGELISLFKETNHPMLNELLGDQAKLYFQAGEYEKSIDCHLESIEFPDPDKTELQVGIDYLSLGMALKMLKRWDQALDKIYEGLRRFKTEKDPYWASRCHFELAEIYFELGMIEQIEEWSRKALDFAELIGDCKWQYTLNFYFGVVNRIKGDLDSADVYLAKAKAQSILYIVDWEFVVKIEQEIARVLTLRGDDDAANEICRRVATIEETLAA